jgi:LysM repeat protein
MRVRTRSACVVLAWGILLIMTAAGSLGSLRPAQANIRIASNTGSTSSTTTSIIHATLTDRVTRLAAGSTASTTASAPGARAGTGSGTGAAAGRYVVQPGDTLSGITAALDSPGGWPALYAANRRVIGPDPGLIRPGTVLALPGRAAPARYTVAAGDTLSAIAAALGNPGGWPALYAANRRVIGPDPNAIHAGTVLAIPRPAPAPAPAPAKAQAQAQARSSAPAQPSTRPSTPASRRPSTPASRRPSTPVSGRPPTPAAGRAPAPADHLRHPASAHPAVVAGLPRWLEIVLLAAGLLIGTAFLTEPTLAIARRRRVTRPAAAGSRIVLADYDRLVVTHCGTDDTVCVLRPPGSDPEAILLAARLVLAQDRYEELAGHLGMPAHWPRE